MILSIKSQPTSSHRQLESFPMTSNSHHRFHSPGNVPFSWENSPGISKVAPRAEVEGLVSAHHSLRIELPPPPCTDDSPRRRAVGRHSIHVPLPPVPFQPTASRYAHLKRDEDPFLAAYMECTKSTVKTKEGKRSCNSGKEGVKRSSGSSWGLSCKQGSGVREDGIVRVSQLAQVREKLLERSQSHGHQRKKSVVL